MILNMKKILAHGTETMETSHTLNMCVHLRKRVHSSESIIVLCPFPSDWTNVRSALITTTLTDIEVVQPTEGRAAEEWELKLETLI